MEVMVQGGVGQSSSEGLADHSALQNTIQDASQKTHKQQHAKKHQQVIQRSHIAQISRNRSKMEPREGQKRHWETSCSKKRQPRLLQLFTTL